MTIRFATSNKDKAREVESLIERDIKREDISLDEIQALEVEKVVGKKAEEAYRQVGQPVIVEDTGLFLEDLDGFPGALTKWVLKTMGNQGLCELIDENRKATAVTVVGLADEEVVKTFRGEVNGRISKKPRGEYDFGWDPVFIPEGYDRTFGELGPETKSEISMRKKAVRELKTYLDGGN